TSELSNSAAEQAKFLNREKVRAINSALFDHTYDGQPTPPTGTYAQRLSGKDGEKIGLARSISVMPGDKINIEVYAKYYDPTASNEATFANLMSAIINNIGVPAGTFVDGSGYGQSTNLPFTPGWAAKDGTGAPPMAYLNWMVFDRNYSQDLGRSGYMRITTNAKETGTNATHDKLFSPEITITQPGYVYIWLSNENPTPVEVYFDDFKVTQTKSPVVATNDYYPFGLTFNSYSRESSMPNRYLFNGGSELQTGMDLGVYSTLFRMYDPALGRFWQVDPLADFFSGINPYSFAFDNPISYNDPDGLAPMWFLKLRANLKQTWYNVTGRGNIQASITGHHGRTLAGERKSVKVYAGKDGQAPAPKPHAQKAADNYGKKDTGGGTPEEPLNEGPFETEREPYPDEPEKKDPVYKGRTIQENKSVSFSENIVFGVNSSAIPKTSENNKVISDLVKVLTDYPQLQLLILGNAGTDNPGQVRFYGSSPQALNQGGMVNGRWTTFGSLMTSRAQAIYNALIKSGIDPSRLTFGPGNLLPTPDGRRTSFVLKN
ncbi:MAG: hypothetical protein IM613_20090, partial [Cytophagales bacterium]|nr:hypothetical protein [Cytophagales bacterium]